jgi:hypothetical protein
MVGGTLSLVWFCSRNTNKACNGREKSGQFGLYGEKNQVRGGFPVGCEISCGTPMVAGGDTNGGERREQWPTAPSMHRGARVIVYATMNRFGHGPRPILLDQQEGK